MNAGIFIIKPEPKVIDISEFITLSEFDLGWRYHQRTDYKQYTIVWFANDLGKTGILICKRFSKSPVDKRDGIVLLGDTFQ